MHELAVRLERAVAQLEALVGRVEEAREEHKDLEKRVRRVEKTLWVGAGAVALIQFLR